MEKLFTTAKYESGALVRQVDQLGKIHASGVVVRQGGQVGVLRLASDKLRSRVVQENVVHQPGPPCNCAVRASESLVADEGVTASVPVPGIVVCAKVVLLWILGYD